jgi:hypothetical protein
MAATIKKPIATQLYKRFNVSQDSPFLYLGDTVIPITNADELTKTNKSQKTTGTATTRTDTYTVPVGKRWIMIDAGWTGNFTVGDCYWAVNFNDGNGDQTIYYVASAQDSGASRGGLYVRGVTLLPGNSFTVIRATAASGSIISNILYQEEDF